MKGDIIMMLLAGFHSASGFSDNNLSAGLGWATVIIWVIIARIRQRQKA